MTPEDLKQIMISDPKNWMTISELSTTTGLDQSQIQKILNKSNLFARSSSSSADGEDLYAAREDFQKNESFAKKIIGAFKNRID